MADLVYSVISSLDGYVVDEHGRFDWAMPDDEVHAFANELQRGVGTCLYGRRLYEVMKVWQTMPTEDDPVLAEFAEVWKAADKVVYSATLETVDTPRTRLERAFDPGEVRRLVDAAERDVSIGGPTLAASAVRAGIIDVWHQIVVPVVVGGGTPWLPTSAQVELELVAERRFASGFVHLGYRTKRSAV